MRLVTIALGGLVVAGFLGALHPLGDSLAVFRVPLLVLFALAVIWSRWGRALRWGLASAALLGLSPHAFAWPDREVAPQRERLTLHQQNLLWNRSESHVWLSEMRRVLPDVITLQEVSVANMALLEELRPLYPSQHHCPMDSRLGEAVLARAPMVPGTARCSGRDGVAAMQIETARGPLWVASVHFSWPYPHDQAGQVTAVLPTLEALVGPVLLAGDFNAVAWSHTVARIEAATRTERKGPLINTFTLPGIAMPVGIDHVLAPEAVGATVIATPRNGSDHRGLFAEFSWPAP